jgi:TonB family protein
MAGPGIVGPSSFGQFAKVTEGHVDANWLSALHDWWDRHGYYPEQAARLQQDGTVRIEMVVDKFGNVRNVVMLDRSGSQWLDLGAQSVFRGAKVPSLQPFTDDDQITVDLTIQYLLYR